MNKRPLTTTIVVTFLALAALLGYSIERTAWLFGQFETWRPAAYAAAVVVELAAVALIVGAGALAHLDGAARAWANRALVAVLSVGALANLSAGYLRGGHAVLWSFGGSWSAYAVAASLWLVVNLAVPGLILCLSKLLERLIATRGRPSVTAQRRWLIRALCGQLRTVRGVLAEVRGAGAEEAQQARAQSAQLSGQLRSAQEEAARLRKELADRSAEVSRLSAEAAAQSAAGALDVRSLAQSLRDSGVALRTIGRALGVSEKTIRNWTVDVRTNGNGVAH